MGRTLVVSIGRNIGSEPMHHYHWTDFKADVWALLKDLGTVVFHGDNVGYTLEEDAYTIIVDRPTGWGEVIWLHAEMGKLARKYYQDAIAMTVGDVRFIGPDGEETTWQ